MRRSPASSLLVAAALALAASPGGCGKKAPLRLPDARRAERAAAPRAVVREGRVTLEFAVPAHRAFPEREAPWVLARILLRSTPAGDFAEIGTILQSDGFAFRAPLAWTDEARPPGAYGYRVEFRDGARRRRALSDPVEVATSAVSLAPRGLRASGDDRAVSLAWSAPAGAAAGLLYRVYRREPPGGALEALTPEPSAALELADARVRRGQEYCYRVRATLVAGGILSEGPAGEEVCVRTEDATPPPPPGAARAVVAAGSVQLSWDAVEAPDLLGYVVYRAIAEGPLEPLGTEPLSGTVYRDDTTGLSAATRCRYAVTAVDDSPRRNESAFSPVAEILTLEGASP